MDKKRALFLCTGNSARSQMAEGLLRHLAGVNPAQQLDHVIMVCDNAKQTCPAFNQ